MIKYKNFDELRNNPLFMVPMINDEIFSQIFANPDLIDNTAYLASALLFEPYEAIKNRVILANFRNITRQVEVSRIRDLLFVVNLSNPLKISVEVNRHYGNSYYIINRNLKYLADAHSQDIKLDSEYEEFIASYQFNLNVYDVKNGKKYIDEYYLRNDEGEILSDGFRISNLKLLDFYDLWYNHSEELNDPGWRKMAFMGALLLENDKEMFNKLLDEAPNDFSDLKERIRTIMEYLNNDGELVGRYLDLQEELEKTKNSVIKEAKKESFDDGIEQGSKERLFKVVQNMLKNQFKITDIEKATGLSKEEIMKIKEEI